MQNKTYFTERTLAVNRKISEILTDFPEFVEDYFVGIEQRTSPLTRLNYAVDLQIFFDYLINNVRYFRGKSIVQITAKDMENVSAMHVERYLSYLTQFEYNNKLHTNDERGKARKLSSVKSFFRYLYRRDMIAQNVTDKVLTPKLHQKEIVRLATDEMNTLLENAEAEKKFSTARQDNYNLNTRDRDIAILTLLLGTGIRVSELVGLDVNDVDLEKNEFVVTRKGGNRAILYFSEEVADALDLWLHTRRNILKKIDNEAEPALFLSLQKKRICVRAVELLVKKHAALAAPLKHITPHKLRSTYGTELYQATGDIYVVAEVLGHKNVNTTVTHYAATSEKIKKSAAGKVKLKKS